MEAMRSTWTDSRLDDLNKRVGRIDDDVRALRGEMREFRVEVREDIRELRTDLGGLQRTIIQVGGGLIGTLLVALLGLIATQL
jgi:hypothetical protein